MTELDMTKLCAEAMGYGYNVWANRVERNIAEDGRAPLFIGYDPLHDDAQAMALLKKFCAHPVYDMNDDQKWEVYCAGCYATDADLNRAIVECIAKLQQSRAKP